MGNSYMRALCEVVRAGGRLEEYSPLRRIGRIEEAVKVTMVIPSDNSDWITVQNNRVRGSSILTTSTF